MMKRRGEKKKGNEAFERSESVPAGICAMRCTTAISCGQAVTLGQASANTECAHKANNDYGVDGEHVTMQAN